MKCFFYIKHKTDVRPDARKGIMSCFINEIRHDVIKNYIRNKISYLRFLLLSLGRCLFHPVVSIPALTWFIRYICY